MADKKRTDVAQPSTSKKHRGCRANASGCVSLANIVESVNIPIDEEQAWAICYQCAKCLIDIRNNNAEKEVFLVSQMKDIYLSRDGSVHEDTFLLTQGVSRERASSEAKMLENLGAVIYEALDYNVNPEEERVLSIPLVTLISSMTDTVDQSSGHETDEGIEEDGGEENHNNHFTVHQVLESCVTHLNGGGSQCDVHYKAVCRALVTEALELSTFLEKISSGSEELSKHVTCVELGKINIRDWARLWVQVIDELRRGVKLKKVEFNPHPIEYALTPYEILMDDIRSRRYKLNKVMINGDLPPPVKKDAHAIILEFIRSRPPLKPVSRRPLNPVTPPPQTTHERLMFSIRSSPRTLRPISKNKGESKTGVTSSSGNNCDGVTQRKLIKIDPDLKNIINFDDDDDDTLLTPDDTSNQFNSTSVFNLPPSPTNWHKTVALDLATYSAVSIPERRHSIHLCDVTPTSNGTDESTSLPNQLSSSKLSPTSTNRTSTTGLFRSVSSRFKRRSFNVRKTEPTQTPQQPPSSCMPSTDEYQSMWNSHLECLSLTLEEVVHIRNVLTKAELENLLAGTDQYDDVAKGKLCFLCKKTRFSFFGPRGQACRLCRRNICDKCCSKMRIPTEHFANIPVYTLSPSPTSSGDDEEKPPTSKFSFWGPSTAFSNNGGSAPSTPVCTSRQPHPMPNDSQKSSSTAKLWHGAAEKIRGSLMTVCKECKSMVVHVIRASRNTLSSKTSVPWRLQIPTSTAVNTSSTITTSPITSLNRETITSQFRLNLQPIYNNNLGN